MKFNDFLVALKPYLPAIISFITALPLLIAEVSKVRNNRSEADHTMANAVGTLVGSVDVVVKPLEDRINDANTEIVRQRQIDRIQRALINKLIERDSYRKTVIRVLITQLDQAGIEPAYRPNGEDAKFREEIARLEARLIKAEECDDASL